MHGPRGKMVAQLPTMPLTNWNPMTRPRASNPPEDLLQAFAGTDYRVAVGRRAFVVRVSRRHPGLDRALARRRWTIVTAHNPGGKADDEPANARRARRLAARADAMGWPRYPAVNRDPRGDWPDEPGLLIAGAGSEAIDELAHAFGQAAVVTGEPDRAAQLRLYGPGWPEPLPTWARRAP